MVLGQNFYSYTNFYPILLPYKIWATQFSLCVGRTGQGNLVLIRHINFIMPKGLNQMVTFFDMASPSFTLAHEQLCWLGLAILGLANFLLNTFGAQPEAWGKPMVCTCRDLWWLVEMCVPQRTANAPPRVTGRLLRAWATIEQPAGHLSSDLINFRSRTCYWWLCENSSNWWYLAQCSVKQYPTPLPCLDLLVSTEGALRLPMTYDNHPIQTNPIWST